MSKCRIQWPVEWLGQKSHTYIGLKNNRHLAFTGEHTVPPLKYNGDKIQKKDIGYKVNDRVLPALSYSHYFYVLAFPFYVVKSTIPVIIGSFFLKKLAQGFSMVSHFITLLKKLFIALRKVANKIEGGGRPIPSACLPIFFSVSPVPYSNAQCI